jgi:hypothetical protein
MVTSCWHGCRRGVTPRYCPFVRVLLLCRSAEGGVEKRLGPRGRTGRLTLSLLAQTNDGPSRAARNRERDAQDWPLRMQDQPKRATKRSKSVLEFKNPISLGGLEAHWARTLMPSLAGPPRGHRGQQSSQPCSRRLARRVSGFVHPEDPAMWYPTLGTVPMTGGSPSFRRSRLMVTATALVKGSACSSHTCSKSSSALRTRG